MSPPRNAGVVAAPLESLGRIARIPAPGVDGNVIRANDRRRRAARVVRVD